MENGNEYLYSRIDDLLNKKNMSRRQLAKAIGVPPTTLQSAFEKKSNISIERLKKILAVLDARYEDVYPPEQLSDAVKHNLINELAGTNQKAAWSYGANRLESSAKENARRLFYELPDDWHRGTAVNWQIEILHKKMGKNCNSAMFEALMQLYQDNEPFSQELAKRLESLVYGQQSPQDAPAGPDDKEPAEK